LADNLCKYYYDDSDLDYFYSNCQCALDETEGYCPYPSQAESTAFIGSMRIINHSSKCHTLDRDNMVAQLECGVGDTQEFQEAVENKFKFEKWA
jgi:hypothetical protein